MANTPAPSDEIVRFRRQLHAHPELAERESWTAQAIATRLRVREPTQILAGLGSMGTGVCAVFDSGAPGARILLRCELDALPIQESNRFAHRSSIDGVSHKCGHDGHMATVIAVADGLRERPLPKGSVYLLFQPAEETGTGAISIIDDPRFQALPPPDFVYALHNVPKYPLGQVLLRRGLFAQGSIGFLARFSGKTSHSSYPEHGLNPAPAVTRLVTAVNHFHESFRGKAAAPVLGTVTFAQLGAMERGPQFGTAPGEGLVTGVVRAQTNEDLALLRGEIVALVARLAGESGVQHELSWHEAFAATLSDPGCADRVARAARRLGLEVHELPEPFRWSEDFGYFTDRYPGAFFGLGSGVDQPQLHEDGYDFPDELIGIGAGLFRAILDLHVE